MFKAKFINKSAGLIASSMLGLALFGAPALGAEIYVTVEGAKQGRFKGESTRKGHEGKVPGISFHYNVKSPRDAASGQASGKRQHSPVTFVKEWGASTPQFFQALFTGEPIRTVLFEFVRTSADGREVVFQTVKLSNAAIVEVDETASEPKSQSPSDTDKISFTFQRIEIENRTTGTRAEDTQGK